MMPRMAGISLAFWSKRSLNLASLLTSQAKAKTETFWLRKASKSAWLASVSPERLTRIRCLAPRSTKCLAVAKPKPAKPPEIRYEALGVTWMAAVFRAWSKSFGPTLSCFKWPLDLRAGGATTILPKCFDFCISLNACSTSLLAKNVQGKACQELSSKSAIISKNNCWAMSGFSRINWSTSMPK